MRLQVQARVRKGGHDCDVQGCRRRRWNGNGATKGNCKLNCISCPETRSELGSFQCPTCKRKRSPNRKGGNGVQPHKTFASTARVKNDRGERQGSRLQNILVKNELTERIDHTHEADRQVLQVQVLQVVRAAESGSFLQAALTLHLTNRRHRDEMTKQAPRL
jgi:hypothetical protein